MQNKSNVLFKSPIIAMETYSGAKYGNMLKIL